MYDYTNKQKALKFGLGASQSGDCSDQFRDAHFHFS